MSDEVERLRRELIAAKRWARAWRRAAHINRGALKRVCHLLHRITDTAAGARAATAARRAQ